MRGLIQFSIQFEFFSERTMYWHIIGIVLNSHQEEGRLKLNYQRQHNLEQKQLFSHLSETVYF